MSKNGDYLLSQAEIVALIADRASRAYDDMEGSSAHEFSEAVGALNMCCFLLEQIAGESQAAELLKQQGVR